MNPEEQAIVSVLSEYEAALNDSRTDAVMKLYTADGVFMPQHFSSSIGATAVKEAYDTVFRTIQLTVRFTIQEVRQTGAEWAFARTNSAGSVLVHATGETSAEANQELFVMQKVEGSWKIARYCFSTTNPPRM
jgi:uncharacterized protein (TIGR02246 family)